MDLSAAVRAALRPAAASGSKPSVGDSASGLRAAVRAAVGLEAAGGEASRPAVDADRKAFLRNVVQEQKSKAKASNKHVTFNFSAIRNMVAQRFLDIL